MITELLLSNVPAFLLFVCRITAFFMVAPVFSFRGVPTAFKIGLALFVAFIAYIATGSGQVIPLDGMYVLSVLRETLVGLLLGFIAYLFFSVVQIAGSFVDLQMGFGVVNVMDPMTGAQSPILGNFKFFIAVLLFLAMDGHHYFLTALFDSYRWVPLQHELFSQIYEGSISEFLVESLQTVFVLAFKMAAPLIAALFLTDVALGILARTAPQFNVFVVGIPLKIVIGFIVFLIMMTGFLVLFQELFRTLLEAVRNMIGILGGES